MRAQNGRIPLIVSLVTGMAEGVSRVVARPLSLEEQLSKFPAELLDSPCADAHLVKLTECFSEWQSHLSTSLEPVSYTHLTLPTIYSV